MINDPFYNCVIYSIAQSHVANWHTLSYVYQFFGFFDFFDTLSLGKVERVDLGNSGSRKTCGVGLSEENQGGYKPQGSFHLS